MSSQYLSAFSCLDDKGTAKIWNKSNSHDGFLKTDQGRAKNCCQIDWIGCPILQIAQKATVRFQFLAYFCNPLANQVVMKNIVKWLKDFLLYFTTKETYRAGQVLKRLALFCSLSFFLWSWFMIYVVLSMSPKFEKVFSFALLISKPKTS